MSQGCPPVKMAIVNVHTTENVNVALCSSFLCHGVTCMQRNVSLLRCEPQRTCQEHGATFTAGAHCPRASPRDGRLSLPSASRIFRARRSLRIGGWRRTLHGRYVIPTSSLTPLGVWFLRDTFHAARAAIPNLLTILSGRPFELANANCQKLANANCQHSVSTQRKATTEPTGHSHPGSSATRFEIRARTRRSLGWPSNRTRSADFDAPT